MLGQCQHANNEVLPTTPTITQRWPNDCWLSGVPVRFVESSKSLSEESLGFKPN